MAKENEVNFGLDTLADFEKNPVWRLVLNDVDMRLKDTFKLLEVAPKETSYFTTSAGPTMLNGVEFLQGEIKSLRFLRALPEMIRKEIEAKSERKEKDEQDPST